MWAEPVLRTARRLRRETGVVFASVAMGALGYGAAGKRFVAGARLPFLQGHRAGTGAIRRVGRPAGGTRPGVARSAVASEPRERAAAPPRQGRPARRGAGREAARALRRSTSERAHGRVRARGRRGRTRHRVPGGREGAGAGVAAQGEAGRGPSRLANPTDVEVAAAEVLQERRAAPVRRLPACSFRRWRREPRCSSAPSWTTPSARASRCGRVERSRSPARRHSSPRH